MKIIGLLDNKSAAKISEESFTQFGATVATFKDMKSFLAAVNDAETPPDMIICDHTWLGGLSRQQTQTQDTHPALGRIPVLFATYIGHAAPTYGTLNVIRTMEISTLAEQLDEVLGAYSFLQAVGGAVTATYLDNAIAARRESAEAAAAFHQKPDLGIHNG